ncbi:MAG: UDP-2,3-diacylglucosamine diphosphatase [Puniceicoccaceae bacterium]|nr:MAG: UDP-2,3-diacylglucosamine diphosphatase [Puniceicoccaceae bacterium]
MAAKKKILYYKTIILSDIHLGTFDCKAEELIQFLLHTRCEKLILNGDIIDGWALKRKNVWRPGHTRIVRRILKIAEKKDTDVIYLRGNHDDFLSGFMPIVLDRIRVEEEHVHTTPNGDYLIVHGDCFDAVTTHSKFLAIMGDIGYKQLLRINRIYNRWRAFRGKEFFSISKLIKAKVKKAVNHISNFEQHLKELAEKRNCRGIICGHIHTAEDKMIDGIHYLNSGDWVESLTAIVENEDGVFQVIDFKQFNALLASEFEPAMSEFALLEEA